MDAETIQELIYARNALHTLAGALPDHPELAELAGDGAASLAEILDAEAGEDPAWKAQRRPPLEPLPEPERRSRPKRSRAPG